MSTQLLHLPFTEQAGASLAINTVDNNRSAQVIGGSFNTDAGHANLHLLPGDYAQISGSPPFNLDNSFTLTAWVKADATGNPTNSFLMLRFAGTDRVVTAVLGSALTSWTLLKIEQQIDGANGSISISLNGSVVESGPYPAGWGTPVGIALYNDDVTTATGNVSWSALLVEADVLIRPQVIGPVSFEKIDVDAPAPAPTGLSVEYYLNGRAFTSFGVTVSDSNGLLDALALKEPTTYDWADQHGEAVDLSRPRFQARTISLDCFILASGPAQLLQRWNDFLAEIRKAYTQRLQVNVFTLPTLVYEVYAAEAIELKKRWHNGQMAGTFTLTLQEPDPLKKVLSFVGPNTLNLTLSSNEALDIHWGDGLHEYDVYGTSLEISHTFTGTGTYYVIIAGLIDEITSLTHNATLVWPRL